MKKINLLYLIILPICYLLFLMNTKLSSSSAFFYGFAENKETELSQNHPVQIHKILVTPGQAVKKGQLLMEVKQASIDFKIDNAHHDIERLEIIAQQQKQTLKDRIDQLKVKRSSKVAAIDAEIKALETSIASKKELLEGLKSFEGDAINSESTVDAVNLQNLKESLTLEVEPIDIEINQLQIELSAIQSPSKVQRKKLKNEIDYFENEQDKLAIVAPSDGLIGNILCKEGENFSAYSTLINFYEKNPTLVKGFVHESLILKVKVGDSLIVSSSLHPTQKIEGEVIGLGSRIVEIPERLRKMPEIKTYGREVLIRIPFANPFLQKEKVMLNSLVGEETNSLAFFIDPFQKSRKEELKEFKEITGSKILNK